jgi:hypothetical protein
MKGEAELPLFLAVMQMPTSAASSEAQVFAK